MGKMTFSGKLDPGREIRIEMSLSPSLKWEIHPALASNVTVGFAVQRTEISAASACVSGTLARA